jgi:hypothetical protein
MDATAPACSDLRSRRVLAACLAPVPTSMVAVHFGCTRLQFRRTPTTGLEPHAFRGIQRHTSDDPAAVRLASPAVSLTDAAIAADLAPAGLQFLERVSEEVSLPLPTPPPYYSPASCRPEHGRSDSDPDEVVDLAVASTPPETEPLRRETLSSPGCGGDQLQQSTPPGRSAGLQSSALLMLAARGDIPPFGVAVFADTGWEPAAVYAQLDRLTVIAGRAGIAVGECPRATSATTPSTPFTGSRRCRCSPSSRTANGAWPAGSAPPFCARLGRAPLMSSMARVSAGICVGDGGVSSASMPQWTVVRSVDAAVPRRSVAPGPG